MGGLRRRFRYADRARAPTKHREEGGRKALRRFKHRLSTSSLACPSPPPLLLLLSAHPLAPPLSSQSTRWEEEEEEEEEEGRGGGCEGTGGTMAASAGLRRVPKAGGWTAGGVEEAAVRWR